MTHNYNFDRPPQLVSVTLFRDVGDLPIAFEENEDGEHRVTEVTLPHAPVEVGDLLLTVDVNGHSYGPKDLKHKLTGVMTLRFQKVNANCNIHCRGAFFYQPQAHTCLPMALDMQQQQGVLMIASIDAANNWLSNTECCIKAGQSVVAINGTPVHQLEDEDALMFIKSKLDLNPYLYITATTLPPDAMTGLLAEEEETLNLFVMGLVTLRSNKMGDNQATARVGDFSAFVTSKQLFVAIQKSLARIQIQNQAACQSLGRGLHSFCQTTLTQVLMDYAQHLQNFLPKAVSVKKVNQKGALKKLGRNITGKAKPTAAWSYKYRIDNAETLERVCQVISTCEYCANQTQALAEMLQEIQDTRNMELFEPIESFNEVIARGTLIMVSAIMQRLKESFWDMRSINYRKIKTVEEENPYVHTMGKEIKEYVDTVAQKDLLPNIYLRSFLDKLVLGFCEVYYDLCLYVLKSVSKKNHGNAIQQLLMDVYHLKEVFLAVPEDSPAYIKLVESSFRSIETLLKGEWQIEYDPASDSDDGKAKDSMKKETQDRENVIRIEAV